MVEGAHVIDADKMGHLAYAPGTACLQALVDHFGSRILNPSTGEVDRRVLGGIVFSDPEQMKALNSIVWPAIRVLLEDEIARVRQSQSEKEGVGVIVVEAAVLVEAGWTDLVHEVWAGEWGQCSVYNGYVWRGSIVIMPVLLIWLSLILISCSC